MSPSAGTTRAPATTLPLTRVADRLPGSWSTALSGLVDIGYVKATTATQPVKINLPKTALLSRARVRMEDPAVEQHSRTGPGAHLHPGLRRSDGHALLLLRRRWPRLNAGRTSTWSDFKVPEEAIGCGFHKKQFVELLCRTMW